jgi:ATP/maltotriose-dependent transcriptional regulator MalT
MPPPVRPELVSRPRLIERLNAGLHCKLTLISAPAGFGKTTLITRSFGQARTDTGQIYVHAEE